MIKAWLSVFKLTFYLPLSPYKNNEEENYKAKYEALIAETREFQEQMEEKDSLIKALRDELANVIGERDEEEQKKKQVEKILELLREENEKLALEHKKKCYSMLEVELEKERETVEAKEKELADATKLCRGYHAALDEANALALTEQAKNAELEIQIFKMKEEEDFLHLTVDDLEQKIAQLKSEMDKLRKLESDSDSNASASLSGRPRRAIASYKTSNSSLSPKRGNATTKKCRKYKTKSKSNSFKRGSASKAVGQEEISDETDEEVPVSRMWGSASSTRRNVGNYDEYEPLSPLLEQDFSKPSTARVRKP